MYGCDAAITTIIGIVNVCFGQALHHDYTYNNMYVIQIFAEGAPERARGIEGEGAIQFYQTPSFHYGRLCC